MAKPAKQKASEKAVGDDLPFEEALTRLESIVEAMEQDDLPLETLLAKYEEGAKLSKNCQKKLVDAELKIDKLEKNASGEPTVSEFEPENSTENDWNL